MTNLYNEYIKSSYKTTSARKIALSLIWSPCGNDDYIDSPSMTYTPYNEAKQADDEPVNVKAEPADIHIEKFQKQINMLSQKIDEYSNTLCQIESYIIDLNKLKDRNDVGEFNTEPIYSILKDYLLKRILIWVNGTDLQGILTEITPEYMKLIEDEHIVVAPLIKVDFIKLPL